MVLSVSCYCFDRSRASQGFLVLLSGLCVAVCGSMCCLFVSVWLGEPCVCLLCVLCERQAAMSKCQPINVSYYTLAVHHGPAAAHSEIWQCVVSKQALLRLSCGLVFEWQKNGHRRVMFGDTVCISVRLLAEADQVL